MKKLLSLIMLITSVALVGCHDDEVAPVVEEIAVTHATLAGEWSLEQYCGSEIPEGTFLTLTFDRKNHTVEMYGNLQSAYPTTRTSSYEIDGDDYYGYTLTGSYGALAGDWQYSYKVVMYADGTMQWTANEDKTIVHKYRKNQE